MRSTQRHWRHGRCCWPSSLQSTWAIGGFLLGLYAREVRRARASGVRVREAVARALHWTDVLAYGGPCGAILMEERSMTDARMHQWTV